MYEAANQTGVVQGSPNTGVDIVPGNVVKVIFVALADFTLTTTTFLTSAAWIAFLADVAKTHAVTPFIDNFKIEGTTPLTEGGNDTTTYNGVPRLLSTSFAKASGMIVAADPLQLKAMRKLAAKSGNFQQGTRVGCFLVHEGTGITGREPSAGAPTIVRAIPCFNIFIGDAEKGGLGAPDKYAFEFHLEGGWSDEQKIYELAFEGAVLTNPAP
ncbi:hypothetical protein GCM10027190_34570 [Spirosoma areae]